MSLTGGLTLRGKLLLMVLVPALGLLWFSGNQSVRELAELRETEQARDLFVTTESLDALVEVLATERGRAFAYSGTGRMRYSSQLQRDYAETDRVIAAFRQSMQAAPGIADSLPDLWAAFLTIDQDLEELVRRRSVRRNLLRDQAYTNLEELNDYTFLLLSIRDIKRSVQTLIRDSRVVELSIPLDAIEEYFLALGMQRAFGSWILAHGELPGNMGISFLASVHRARVAEERLAGMPFYTKYHEQLRVELAAVNYSLVQQVTGEIESYLGRLNRFRKLQSAIGYGGLIHQFKNYVMRGDDRYRIAFEQQFAALDAELSRAAGDESVSALTRQQIGDILSTFREYAGKLAIAQRLHAGNAPLAQIEKAVKVDDGAALAAVRDLFSFAFSVSAEEWFRAQSQHIAIQLKAAGLIREELFRHVQGKVQEQRRALLFHVLLTTLLLVISFFVMVVVYRDTLRSIRSVAHAVDDIANDGRLDVELPESRNDEIGLLVSSLENLVRNTRAVIAQAGRIGQGDYTVIVTPRSDEDQLAHALNAMVASLVDLSVTEKHDRQLKERLVAMSDILRLGIEPVSTAQQVLEFFCEQAVAEVGVFYLPGDEAGLYEPCCAHSVNLASVDPVHAGQGLVGRVISARELSVHDKLPNDYLAFRAGVGNASPSSLLILPLWERNDCVGAIELGKFGNFTQDILDFIPLAQESIALGLQALMRRRQLEQYVIELDERRAALEQREADLQAMNAELQSQAEQLQASEEELRCANEELNESTAALRDSHAKLQLQAQELELASKYKTEFLANMSHELRTPLNSILILSRDLAENHGGNLTREQIDSASLIDSSGRGLLELINDILDLSKVEAGKLELVPEPMIVRDFVRELGRLFTPQARHKNIELSVECTKSVPEQWVTDSHRVGQVLKNFLSNAVKFTSAGRVLLRVTLQSPQAEQAEGPDLLRFDVIDSGVGIEQGQLANVFEHFRQEDGSTSREYGGTGLGLSISRSLSELLGGSIEVESVKGVGSTFSLLLPEMEEDSGSGLVSDDPDHPEAPVRDIVPVPKAVDELQLDAGVDPDLMAALNEKKIIIADDDLRNCFSLSSALRRYGMYVLLAKDGGQCIEKLHEHPDVAAVVLDLMMPVMDGFQTLEVMRGDYRLARIPVVLLTARSMPTDEARAREAGAADFLMKPIAARTLALKLAEILGGK